MEKGGYYDYRDDDRIIPQGQIVNVQPPDEDMKSYVKKRYDNAINYYWKAGSANKRTYKRNRSLVIVLGTTVTLLSSMISANFINGNVETLFAIAAPVSAAILTMLNSFTQSFQSGAAWRDMVLSAERLEKERDRFLAIPDAEKNYKRELSVLNSIVVNESSAFFKRILDSEYQPDPDDDKK